MPAVPLMYKARHLTVPPPERGACPGADSAVEPVNRPRIPNPFPALICPRRVSPQWRPSNSELAEVFQTIAEYLALMANRLSRQRLREGGRSFSRVPGLHRGGGSRDALRELPGARP